jgi:hypothetical protein
VREANRAQNRTRCRSSPAFLPSTTIRPDCLVGAATRRFDTPKNHLRRDAPLTVHARGRLAGLAREGEFCFVSLCGEPWTPSSRAYHWKAVRAAAGWSGSLNRPKQSGSSNVEPFQPSLFGTLMSDKSAKVSGKRVRFARSATKHRVSRSASVMSLPTAASPLGSPRHHRVLKLSMKDSYASVTMPTARPWR